MQKIRCPIKNGFLDKICLSWPCQQLSKWQEAHMVILHEIGYSQMTIVQWFEDRHRTCMFWKYIAQMNINLNERITDDQDNSESSCVARGSFWLLMKPRFYPYIQPSEVWSDSLTWHLLCQSSGFSHPDPVYRTSSNWPIIVARVPSHSLLENTALKMSRE